MPHFEDVLRFWFGKTPREQWFRTDSGFDAHVRLTFGALHAQLADAVSPDWRAAPRPLLAAVIVLDQFSRNLHRGDALAYACDPAAVALAEHAIAQGWDRELTEDEAMFLYLPLEHSERLADVERSAALMARFTDPEAADYARRHAAVIRRFGRYPARNAALGREITPEEAAFLAENPAGF